MLILELDDEARAELEAAADYYDLLQSGLGTRFENDLMRVRDRILSNPFMYAEEDDGFRYATFEVFPYSLIYKAYDNRILVVAASHHKQRPGYWHRRIRNRS